MLSSSTKKILEQAYNRKFSLSETIQVVNRLSSETIQSISSARRGLDEMLDGRGKAYEGYGVRTEVNRTVFPRWVEPVMRTQAG